MFTMLLRDRERLYDRIISGENLLGGAFKMAGIALAFFALYGFVMGIYNSPLQSLASALKVPLLFFLALLICYPALFMFNILLGSKLSLGQSFNLIISSFALSACILASFAPISLFFLFIGSSYAFLRLLHVAIFAVAGLAGMKALNDGLVFACENYNVYPKNGVHVFRVWVIIFAFVGTQLAWNLRPFLGNRELEFQLFRKQESNFYAHVLKTASQMAFGNSRSESYYRDPHLKEMGEEGDIEEKLRDFSEKPEEDADE